MEDFTPQLLPRMTPNNPAHPTATSRQIEFRLPPRREWPQRSAQIGNTIMDRYEVWIFGGLLVVGIAYTVIDIRYEQ